MMDGHLWAIQQINKKVSTKTCIKTNRTVKKINYYTNTWNMNRK